MVYNIGQQERVDSIWPLEWMKAFGSTGKPKVYQCRKNDEKKEGEEKQRQT